jgi:hypothetical protein
MARNSKFNYQPVLALALALFWDMEGVILVRFTPYNPNLTPRNFHTFGPMKEVRWRGAKLVKIANKNLFDGIKKFAKRWKRSVEVEGITLKSNISFVFVHLK